MAGTPEKSLTTSKSKDAVVPKSQPMDIWGGVFTVLVGKEKKPLVVHETVLGSSSAFFQKAMKPDWVESRPDPKTIDMSHCDAELFSTYIHWLYFKTIPMEKVNSSKDKGFQSLAGAYILGEEFMDVSFKNAIINIFVTHNLIAIPSPETVETIYDGTSKNSLGRRLMSDIYAYSAHADHKDGWNKALEKCPRDFLVDVLKTVIMTRDRPSARHYPWIVFKATYHEKVPN